MLRLGYKIRVKKCILLLFCFNIALLIHSVSLNMTVLAETHLFNTELRILQNKIF